MLIPTFRTWTDDELVTPTMMNTEVRDGGNFLKNRPQAFMKRSNATQEIADNTVEVVTYESIDQDTDGMASIVTNEITCVTPGFYFISAVTYLQCLDGLQNSLAIIRVENSDGSTGTNIARGEKDHDDRSSTGYTLGAFQKLNVGDRIFLQVLGKRTAGGTKVLTVNPAGAASSLAALWVGE